MRQTGYREKPYRPRRRLKREFRIALAVFLVLSLAAVTYTGVLVVRHLRTINAPGAQVSAPEWVEEDLLPRNPYSRPGTALTEISGVVIHYVGNPATSASANRSYFAGLALSGDTYASSHFIVGLEGEIIQCVPLSEVAYCSNERNSDTVAIEVCHEDESGEFSPETLESVTRLTAWLCAQFDLTEEDVIRHYDVTGKSCPKYYVEHEDAWLALRESVAEQIPLYRSGESAQTP